MVRNGTVAVGERLRTVGREAGPALLQGTVFVGSFLPLNPSLMFPEWAPADVPGLVACAAVGAASTFAVRRRPGRTWPLVAVALLGWLVVSAWPALCVASYRAGTGFPRTSRLLGYTAVAGLAVVLPGVIALTMELPWSNWSFGSSLGAAVLFVGLPLVVGLWVSARRQVVRGLRERAEQLEFAQAVREERARLRERSRIAHEMHDVVAHRVTLMVLHAGALEVNARDAELAAEAALIRGIGREALTQLREVLGVLRGAQSTTEPAVEPGPEAVEMLVRQSSEAGLDVEVQQEGELADVPIVVQHTAYRMVREALTNVHKHAGGARTEVVLRRRDAELLVEVRNAAPHEHVESIPGSGLGLVGLRERVDLLGGRFRAAPGFDGGFVVSARIPLTPSESGDDR